MLNSIPQIHAEANCLERSKEIKKGDITAFANTFVENEHQAFPEGITNIIHQYYHTWRWDVTRGSGPDHKLLVSCNGQRVTSPQCFSKRCNYSSIFLDRWMTKEGRYYFKFRFHGHLRGLHNEVSIGLVSDQYEMSNRRGIGSNQHGWAWYAYSHQESSIFFKTFRKSLDHGLKDMDTFALEVVIQKGSCRGLVHYYGRNNAVRDGRVSYDYVHDIEYSNVAPPVTIGVSFKSALSPVAIEIIDQKGPPIQ